MSKKRKLKVTFEEVGDGVQCEQTIVCEHSWEVLRFYMGSMVAMLTNIENMVPEDTDRSKAGAIVLATVKEVLDAYFNISDMDVDKAYEYVSEFESIINNLSDEEMEFLEGVFK